MVDLHSEYSRLIEAIDLSELHLVRGDFSRHESLQWPLQVEEHFSSENIEQVERSLIAQPTFGLEARSGDATDPLIVIRTVWRIKYDLGDGYEGEVPDELLGVFARRNVPMNVWPHMRSFVMLTTAQMGLPPLVLKALKILG